MVTQLDPNISVKNVWWHWRWRVCPQRILIVTDGLDFSVSGFGLSEAINVLKAAVAGYQVPSITTAHRSASLADLTNFKFDNSQTPAPPVNKTFNFNNYDQVWLYGVWRATNAPLSNLELQALSDFMDAGGGVFATGDHEDLGASMCGRIPRVRSMRSWFNAAEQSSQPWAPVAPDGGSNERIDTLTPGGDDFFQFDDQSDAHPQRIHIRYFDNASSTAAFDYKPHPLMQRANTKPILHFPDHPHEGVCVEPSTAALGLNYQFTGAAKPEYPNSSVTKPYVIATGFSGGGYMQGKPPVIPRCFGVVSAYDGHLASVGRVACDSTWHHWTNINLNGANTGRTGFYIGGVRTPEYNNEICQYFRNLVRWLSPTRILWCWHVIDMIQMKFTTSLVEEWKQPAKLPAPLELIRMGQLVSDAARSSGLTNFEVDASIHMLGLVNKELALPLQAWATPWADSNEFGASDLIPLRELRLTVLGAAMYAVWDVAIGTEEEVANLDEKRGRALRDRAQKMISQLVPLALSAYLSNFEERLVASRQTLKKLSPLGKK